MRLIWSRSIHGISLSHSYCGSCRSRNPDSEKTKEADVAAAERSAEELGGKEVKSRFADASSTGTQLSNRRPREPRGSIVLL